jgi:hypothetical protein
MKVNSQVTVSMRFLVIILVVLFALSAINTFLIFERTSGPPDTSAVNYDYVVSQDGSGCLLKNMLTGSTTTVPTSLSYAINILMSEGKSVYINPGTYTLTQNVLVANKINAKIVSDGATIIGNGFKIIIRGDNYTASKYAIISGLTLINATIRIEDSFTTTISNIIFENTSTGIEFANINTWSEYNKIDNCQFINASEGIAFRTPTGNATGSYASSEINRCSFNIRDNSIGIIVESLAQLSDSQLQDVRFWLGQDGKTNQIGILNNGSMDQTLLQGVVFESFADQSNSMYALDLGETCNPAPIVDGGVSFLGNWTARIYNPFSKWISGIGSAFEKANQNVPLGTDNQYTDGISIQTSPLKMYSFKPKIEVSNLASGEVITVMVRFEYVDNVISGGVEKIFSSNQALWLSDDDMMTLYPSQNIIWAVLVDAKSNQDSTNALVNVGGYGTAG